MVLISRISRLFKADFHAVLDRVEEPHMLLEQAIREMEEELSAGERRQRQLLAERDELQAHCEEMQQTLAAVDEELDICFEDENNELARTCVRRKLEVQRVLKRLSKRLELSEQALLDGKKTLAENGNALESARQKAALFKNHQPYRSTDGDAPDHIARSHDELAVNDSDVEVALLVEKKRRAR